MRKLYIISFLWLSIGTVDLLAQSLSPKDEFLLAREYAANNELEKAKSILEKLSKKQEHTEMIYTAYLNVLDGLQLWFILWSYLIKWGSTNAKGTPKFFGKF